jgi:hypothetical protein
MNREEAKKEWEKRNVSNYLDEKGHSHPNPHYVKRELIDGKIVESMPNKVILEEEE